VLPAVGGSPARTIIATTVAADNDRAKPLTDAGAEVWRLAFDERGKVRLGALADALAANDLTSVLVEGGGEVHAAVIAAGLADELRIYIAPIGVGGPAPSWIGGAGIPALAGAARWRWDGAPEPLGEDWLLRAVSHHDNS
jgi:diaminohydroxyphosphoribosylaminopyrimidine deaminase/5-amino-6-(5-phosphoribosylamino)uracil reductase